MSAVRSHPDALRERALHAVGVTPHATLVLVEDSDEDYALFLRVFRTGWQVHRWVTAEDALAAIDRGEPAMPDVAAFVVDLHLPGMDGVEFVRRVRDRPEGQAPALCMLSSSVQPRDTRRALEAGADAYLVKPRDADGLRALPNRLAEIIAGR